MLIDIFENPLSGIAQRYKRLKINPRYGNRYKKQLISEGCIQPRKVVTDEFRTLLFDLTQKGRLILHDLGYDVENKSEGIVHKFWKNRIAEDYEAHGYEVSVEEYINGRPDIIARKDGKKIAIEIETGKSNFMKNIWKNADADFDEIVCVATDERVEERMRGVLDRQKR